MRTLLLSAALLTSTVATAAIPIDGWYGGLFGGFAYLPSNLSLTSNNTLRDHAVYNNAYDAGGHFGFKSTPLRYEGELTYINAQLEHFKVDGIAQTGVIGFNSTSLAMANVYYDFPAVIRTLEPFLGLGLGYGYIDASYRSTGPLGLTHYSNSDSVFAYQATAGLTYNFAEALAFNIGYRYVATDNTNHFGKMFQANLANIGAVYRFDGSIYK